MTVSNGDVVRFTVVQGLETNPILNTFTYQIDEVAEFGGDIAGIAQAFWNAVKEAWRACVPTVYGDHFKRVLVDDITNELDFGSYEIPTLERAGTRAAGADYVATWICFPVRLNVSTRLTHPGQKRFSCLVEADVTGPLITAAAIITPMTTFAGYLSIPIHWGAMSIGQGTPVIYGPILAPTQRNPAGRPAVVVNPVTSATPVTLLTSQRSRRQ